MRPWVETIPGRHPAGLASGAAVPVGILMGEGVGPEVVSAARIVLAAACRRGGHALDLAVGPDASTSEAGKLTEETAEFCRDTFARGGAVLTGPHGGRWVYELRQRFDLFCKINPLRPSAAIAPEAGPTWPDRLRGVDIVVVREQGAGVYQGRWSETDVRREGHVAGHSFSYSARDVRRIVEVGVRLAAARRGKLALVVKLAGVPSISRLWIEVGEEVARGAGVETEIIDIDFAVYRLLRDPLALDVLVAPNLFGDVLADAGGLMLGSRGLTYGASYDGGHAAVYQTNHGSAHDLAGRDRANPVAQILSAAAMLRESFDLFWEADAIEEAVEVVWRGGWRTEDLAETGCSVIGTREFGERVADHLAERSAEPSKRGAETVGPA